MKMPRSGSIALLAPDSCCSLRSRSRPRVDATLVQIMMVLMVAAGALGIYFHFHGSREFQLEMDPQMRGTTLVWHVLRAKSPPTLAPGSMMQLGILGLGYAYLRRNK